MNLNIATCTYNMGSRPDDYFQLCRHLNSSMNIKSKDDEIAFLSKYDATQRRTAEYLEDKASAYLLQEVVDENRPLVRSLKDRNFEIIHLNGIPYFDTAIALDRNRFKDITNHSISVEIAANFKKDIAIATATDILTGQRVTFVSAHVPGFDFTKAVTEEDAAEGDLYCRAIAQKLSQIGKGTIQIIGADTNANPEKWNPRFQIFSRQGFQTHRTNSATNVNPKDSSDKEREIDFIFVKIIKSTIWQKIKNIFFSTFQFKASIKRDRSIGWNAFTNASDHMPVFVDILPKVNISKIRLVWNIFCLLFKTHQPVLLNF